MSTPSSTQNQVHTEPANVQSYCEEEGVSSTLERGHSWGFRRGKETHRIRWIPWGRGGGCEAPRAWMVGQICLQLQKNGENIAKR
eukprot:1180314-Prorocentrum_minimum.AAC.4